MFLKGLPALVAQQLAIRANPQGLATASGQVGVTTKVPLTGVDNGLTNLIIQNQEGFNNLKTTFSKISNSEQLSVLSKLGSSNAMFASAFKNLGAAKLRDNLAQNNFDFDYAYSLADTFGMKKKLQYALEQGDYDTFNAIMSQIFSGK